MATENIPSRLHCVAEGNVLAGANEILDDDKGKKQTVINQENDQRLETLETAVGTGGSVDSRIESAKTEIVGGASSDCNTLGKAEALISTNANDIAALQEAYAALTQNDVVVVEPSDTWPVPTPEQNIIYRVVDRTNTPPQYYADYMWNGTAMVEMAQYNNAIDAVPTAGSHNLVESGGVQNELALGAVYDVTAHNSNATFDSLEALLSDANLNTLIPTSVRKGGMSIKFVQSSDNKYVQFFCTADEFTTDITKWQGVDDEPTAGSGNLVKSGGVYTQISENYSKTANSLYTLKKNLGSVTNTLLELNNQATHYVFEIEGGDVLHILTSNFCKVAILKSFDFTHSLPYTFDFATGESIRGGSIGGNLINVTAPLDAKYVCLTAQQSDGTNTVFSEFTINGVNFLTKNSLKDYTDNKVNTEKTRAKGVEQTLLDSTSLLSTKVDSALFNISDYNYYSGSLDNSGAIVSYNQSTYIVIPVTPEESFYIKAGTVAKFAFVKDFEFNHSLPYTLDLCNGTNVTPLASGSERLTTIPSDAKYLLLSRNGSDGSGILPIELNIGDKNYLDCDINDIISNIKSELDELEDSLVETIDIQTSQEIYLYGDDGSKVASSNFNGTGLFDIQDGDVIEYTGSMGSGYHGLLIYSDENTIIGTAFTNGDFSKARYAVNNQNAKYARCQARNSNWGTVPNQLKVSVKSKIATEIENLSERVTILENQINIKPSIIIEKNGDGAFDVKIKQQSNEKYLTHKFLRHRYTRLVRYGSSGSATHEERCSDCWYPSQIYDGTINLLQGNANFINYIEKEHERSYAGEGHGATFSAYVHFFADGVEFDPNTLTGRIECGIFRFVEKNIIYAIDTTQPNFNSDNAIPKFDENGNKEISTIHWLEAKYSVNNIIEFRHRLSIARNNTQFRFCFGAMLELERELFNHIIINNPEGSENLVSYDSTQSAWTCTPINGSTVALASESTNRGDEIVAYGNNYMVKQKMLQADTSRNSKSSMFPRLYTGSGYRIKFYQQPVVTTSNYPAIGLPAETFNNGDAIELFVERNIEFL